MKAVTDSRRADARFKTKWDTTPKVHSVVHGDKFTSSVQPRKGSQSQLPSSIIGSAAPISGKNYVESTYTVPESLSFGGKEELPVFETEPGRVSQQRFNIQEALRTERPYLTSQHQRKTLDALISEEDSLDHRINKVIEDNTRSN